MVKLEYSLPARNDLKSIYNFISFDSENYAKKFIKEIKDRVRAIKSYPEQGRVVYPDKFKE